MKNKQMALILGLCFAAWGSIPVQLSAQVDIKNAPPHGTVSATNNIYEIFVQDKVGLGVGICTIRTGANHPVPFQNLLFGGAGGSPGTSFATIRSYTTGTDYVQTPFSPSSTFRVISLDAFGVVQPLGPTEIGQGFKTVYNLPGPPITPDHLLIEQTVKITGITLSGAKVEVTTLVTNQGLTPLKIGIRYLWDFEIGADDGPVFVQKDPDGLPLTTEESFPSPRFRSYQIQDNDKNPTSPLYTVQGSAFNPTSPLFTPTAPDLVQYVAWPRAFPTAFDYTTNASLDIATTAATISGFSGGDSAVLYFFGPVESNSTTVLPFLSTSVTTDIFATPPPLSVSQARQCAFNSGEECLISAASLLADITNPPLGALLDIGLAAEGICDAATSFAKGEKADFVVGTTLTTVDIVSVAKSLNLVGPLNDLVSCAEGLVSDLCGGTQNIPRCVTDAFRHFGEGTVRTVKHMLQVFAGSPVNLQIFDSQGNRLLLDASGNISATIPKSWLFQIAGDKQLAVVDNALDEYEIKVVGRADAPPGSTFNLAILQPKIDGTFITITYDNVSTRPGAIASLKVSGTSTNYGLNIDIDGDGVVDLVRQPNTVFPAQPNHPPLANAGSDQVVECGGHTGTLVTLDGSASSDPDGDPLTFEWKDANGNVVGTTAIINLALALGTHTFTLTVSDGKGGVAMATTHVTVRDTTPPKVTASLVPAGEVEDDEGLFQVVFSCSDKCDASPRSTANINGVVVSNGQIVKLELEDEKQELEVDDGRLEIQAPSFLLTVSCTDASGNSSTATVTPPFAPNERQKRKRKHGRRQ